MAADLHAVVEDAKLVTPVLVGLSMGGTIVLQYALDYPDALSHLVVADAPAGIPEAFQPQQQQELHLINTVSVSETAHRRMEKAFATRNQQLRQWMIAMIERMDTESYRSQANAVFAFNVWDRLREITTPTTLVWGALDAIIPVQMGLAMQQMLPGSTLRVIEACGHFVNLEAPEAFHAILAEILGVPTPASGAMIHVC
jgi:3-oxoadipate enol-lactonase